MRTRMSCAALIAAAIFLHGIVVCAQTAQSNGDRIRSLRAEIQRRATIDVPDDLKELNRSKLIERRAELRTLLLTEIDNLQKYKVNLGPFTVTPEEVKKADDSISEYRAEIGKLGEAIQQDLASSGIENPAAPVLQAAPNSTTSSFTGSTEAAKVGTRGPVLPDGRARNQAVVGSSESNSGAVAHTPAPQATPTPTKLAVTGDATSSGGGPLDCKDVSGTSPSKGYSEIDKQICGIASHIRENRTNNGPKNLVLNSTDYFRLIKVLIARNDAPDFLVKAEEARLDKQVGSAPANSGSTSLVVKGGAPAVLGFAVENGALTQNVNGNSVTFRGNPVGLIDALSNKGFITIAKDYQNDPIVGFLKKTSFAFTFNTDRGPDPGVFTATKQQLSSFSGRIEFINKRKPELYIKDWENFLEKDAVSLNRLLKAGFDQLTVGTAANPGGEWQDPALQAWFETTQQALSAASDSEVDSVLQARLDKLPVKQLLPTTVLLLNGIEKALGTYVGDREALLDKINSGTVVTLEYLNKREVNAPDTSNFNFIAEKGTANGKLDFTLNASLTLFNDMSALRNFVKLNPTLPAPRRLRDFQFAGHVDVPLKTERGQFVLFAAGRYERLLENASTPAGMILPNTKGDIGHLQVGLKVPIKGTGFKIPISVTFANRTELVKEKTIRGNFGFTLDLDTLLAKFKPF